MKQGADERTQKNTYKEVYINKSLYKLTFWTCKSLINIYLKCVPDSSHC